MSYINPFLAQQLKYRLKTKKNKKSNGQNEYDLPLNASNRNTRWTHSEKSSLKLAMTIFGDQSWKKIQRYLVNRELDSRKSKTIKKSDEDLYYHTKRSVKAIQSKIYQIKPEVEQEYSIIKDKLMMYDLDIKEHLKSLKKKLNKEDMA